MSRKYIWLLIAALSVLAGFKLYPADEMENIRKGFIHPPDSVRVTTFYYWLNNHISKDGVIKDLYAMKEAGITRVFIGTNIRNRTDWSRDTTGKWFGNVKVFSKEWWDIVHVALKTATALDIEVGLFNCPGWSQSGGPWVKPNQAMRYLDATELRVKGPLRLQKQLAKTDTFFQDVKVLAMRVPSNYRQNLIEHPGTKIKAEKLEIISSANEAQAHYVLKEKESFLNIELPKTETVRSLSIYPFEMLNATVDVQVKVDTGYQSVKKAELNRSRAVEDLAKGFEPYSPCFLPLGNLTARSFRLVFHQYGGGNSRISKLVLSPTPVIKDLLEKKLAKVVGSSPWWTGSAQKTEALSTADVALPAAQDVLDISKNMDAKGNLDWNVPKGEWVIIRTGMRFINVMNGPASFEAEGLEVDKLSRQNIQMHFNAFIGEILKRVPANDRRTLKMVVMDSYERGGTNFTDSFLVDFKKRYGYDATPYLPVYSGHMISSPAISDRFLWDVRRLVADKLSYDYIGGMREISHRNGLRTWLENYGHSGYPGEFLQYGGQSDEVAGEYWVEPISDRRFENRGAASTAHIYGKNKVWAESFTSGSWAKSFEYSTYPQELKSLGDQAFTQGINSTVLHLYIQQAYEDVYPGVDAWFGTEFNRKNTWFKHMDLFTLYHRRCNYMLQQGRNVADVAYYIGEDNPIMRGVLEPELPKGYNYDYINAEVITRDLQVKNGRFILPNGTSYRVLVLPPQETMRLEVLQKIEKLVSDGGIVLGSPPSRSPSLQNYPQGDQNIRDLASKLWTSSNINAHAYGKGKVYSRTSLQEIFKEQKITADLITNNNAIAYTHRTLNGKEIYFLANLTGKPVNFEATFRVNGLQPELWDALSGETRRLPAYEKSNGHETVPLKLAANGSAFIIFNIAGVGKGGGLSLNYPEPISTNALNGTWRVGFEHDSIKRGPNEPVFMSKLQDWSMSDDERVRHYSGTAIYNTTFILSQIKEKSNYYIDLGKVSATAKVKVNGKYVGGVWTYPYRLNLTGVLVKGKNSLQVEVINTWRNRLLGDRELPLKDRRVRSRISIENKNDTLQPSGLFGPVAIVETKK
ncbi:glycosyl hydrolase [Mucilaginibacter sp. PAMB04274]|uniref:glycosyl hydrolase n=1 Tax=Mucilaginibacter sp. PAMB04274 TaxID=3138568 RepID=UPI0031F6EA31